MLFSVVASAIIVSATVFPASMLDAKAADKPLTREEAAVSLLLAKNPTPPSVRNHGEFSDVREGNPLSPYLIAAFKTGLLSPDIGTNRLRPTGYVSRGEFAKMLTYTFDIDLDIPHHFTDISPDSWYVHVAGIASRYDVFLLKDQFTFDPGAVVTKAEGMHAIQLLSGLRTSSAAPQVPASAHTSLPSLRTVTSVRRIRTVLRRSPTISPASNPQVKRVESGSELSLNAIRRQVLAYTNQQRAAEHLPALAISTQLNTSAQIFAEKMAALNFFDHTAPDGETLEDRIALVRYREGEGAADGRSVGENIAKGYSQSAAVTKAWIDSPHHRDNILSPLYREIGIGYAKGYWVQHFGGSGRESPSSENAQ